jgi:sugar/nucleoside kinase (ribokinase family)
VELAEREGTLLSLDPGQTPARKAGDDLRRLLPRLAVCTLGLDEARWLLGVDSQAEVATGLLARGVGLVGVKLGRRGCLVMGANGRAYTLPACSVRAVDSTGAGDAFAAGLLFAHLRGLSVPAAGVLANAMGALASTVWGGAAMPGSEALISLLRAQGRPDPMGEDQKWIAETIGALSYK